MPVRYAALKGQAGQAGYYLLYIQINVNIPAEFPAVSSLFDYIAQQLPEDERIYNTYYPRSAALAKALGTCDYGDDIAIKGRDFLYLAPIMPDSSHANILSVDYSGMEHVISFALSEDYSDYKKHNSLAGAGFPYLYAARDEG